MQTLRNAAVSAKGELYQLESIDLDKVEVKDKSFNKTEKIDGKDVTKTISFKVLIVDGKEFSIKEKQLNQIKEAIDKKPLAKKVRFMKLDDGKIICLALD